MSEETQAAYGAAEARQDTDWLEVTAVLQQRLLLLLLPLLLLLLLLPLAP